MALPVLPVQRLTHVAHALLVGCLAGWQGQEGAGGEGGQEGGCQGSCWEVVVALGALLLSSPGLLPTEERRGGGFAHIDL